MTPYNPYLDTRIDWETYTKAGDWLSEIPSLYTLHIFTYIRFAWVFQMLGSWTFQFQTVPSRCCTRFGPRVLNGSHSLRPPRRDPSNLHLAPEAVHAERPCWLLVWLISFLMTWYMNMFFLSQGPLINWFGDLFRLGCRDWCLFQS